MSLCIFLFSVRFRLRFHTLFTIFWDIPAHSGTHLGHQFATYSRLRRRYASLPFQPHTFTVCIYWFFTFLFLDMAHFLLL